MFCRRACAATRSALRENGAVSARSVGCHRSGQSDARLNAGERPGRHSSQLVGLPDGHCLHRRGGDQTHRRELRWLEHSQQPESAPQDLRPQRSRQSKIHHGFPVIRVRIPARPSSSREPKRPPGPCRPECMARSWSPASGASPSTGSICRTALARTASSRSTTSPSSCRHPTVQACTWMCAAPPTPNCCRARSASSTCRAPRAVTRRCRSTESP